MTSDFVIRKATPEDAPAVTELIIVLGYKLDQPQVAEQLALHTTPSTQAWVALHEGKVVGFLSFHAIPMFHESGNLGRITAMAIHPAYQRRGVGRGLVTTAEDYARSYRCKRMEVTSGDHREQDAHLFYQAQGYNVDCRRFLKRL